MRYGKPHRLRRGVPTVPIAVASMYPEIYLSSAATSSREDRSPNEFS
jgi:hypothetical protein